MGTITIVSSTVYTTRDAMGNPRTESWHTLEFNGDYESNGNSVDLSPQFKRIDYILPGQVSGGVLRGYVSGLGLLSAATFLSGSPVNPVPVVGDFATPTSARFRLWGRPTPSLSGWADAQNFNQPLQSGAAGAISGLRFVARVLGG